MKFTLEITLGNEAMSSAHDVSDALANVVGVLNLIYSPGTVSKESGNIRDINGSTVGLWEFTEE